MPKLDKLKLNTQEDPEYDQLCCVLTDESVSSDTVIPITLQVFAIKRNHSQLLVRRPVRYQVLQLSQQLAMSDFITKSAAAVPSGDAVMEEIAKSSVMPLGTVTDLEEPVTFNE